MVLGKRGRAGVTKKRERLCSRKRFLFFVLEEYFWGMEFDRERGRGGLLVLRRTNIGWGEYERACKERVGGVLGVAKEENIQKDRCARPLGKQTTKENQNQNHRRR